MNISVIIPTYNRSEFIEQTINSVLNQTKMPNEIIIVDDGSTDNTYEIIAKLIDIYPCIKYIKQTNSGVSNARNTGIINSINNWLCFLDSDDIWNENKIEEQINFHTNNPTVLFSHSDEVWKFNTKIIKKKKHQLKPSGDCFLENINNTLIGASTIMIHKSIFEKVGLFDENLIACEDFDMWLRILYHYELGYIDEELIIKVAGHSNQLSFITPMMDKYRIIALEKHIKSKYKKEVINLIKIKCNILIKGAVKYNNQSINDCYTNLLLRLN